MIVGSTENVHTELSQIIQHSRRGAEPAAAALGAAAGFKVVDSRFQVAETEITLADKIADFGKTFIFALKRQAPGDHRIPRCRAAEARRCFFRHIFSPLE